MSQSIITVTYSGSWNPISGNWSQIISTSSQGGSNGELRAKLRHPNYGDYWDEIYIGFLQFNTSSLPDNCTIHSAYLRVQLSVDNKGIGGLGAGISNMAVGWRTDGAIDEWTTGNILGNPVEGYTSGLRNFVINSPNTRISKTGWTKYHIATSNVIDRVSPGIAAPTGDGNRDDFWIGGYDYAPNPARLVINWTTPPAVTTNAISNLGVINAVGNATITDVGGGTVSACGICLNKTGNPTVSDTIYQSADLSGDFSVNMTGLIPGTKYYIRAYVTTENSTQYGNQVVFVTPSPLPIFAAMI